MSVTFTDESWLTFQQRKFENAGLKSLPAVYTQVQQTRRCGKPLPSDGFTGMLENPALTQTMTK